MYAANEAMTNRRRYRSAWTTRIMILGLGACAIGATKGIAATTVTHATVVRVSTLDPQSHSEAEHLYRDIERAADRVCGEQELRVLRQWRARRACMADAIARAVEQIDSPVLSALHLQHVDGVVPERAVALDRTRQTAR